MLHIFLVILKMIGIILAILLGIVVFLVLSLLFWPVRYHIEGKHFDKWEGRARISFWGPVIWLRIVYREKLSYKVRVFGIPVLSSEKKSASRKVKNRKSPVKGHKKTSVLDEEEESAVWEKTKPLNRKNSDWTEDESESVNEEQKAEDRLTFGERLSNVCQMLKKKLQKLLDTIKNVFVFWSSFKETWEDESVRTGLRNLKAETGLFLKKLQPRKLKWYVRFGFENPASTGQLLAVLAILQGIWGKELYLEPDFENQVLETEFDMKGLLQGFRLVRLGWKIYFDKDIQHLYERAGSFRQ